MSNGGIVLPGAAIVPDEVGNEILKGIGKAGAILAAFLAGFGA